MGTYDFSCRTMSGKIYDIVVHTSAHLIEFYAIHLSEAFKSVEVTDTETGELMYNYYMSPSLYEADELQDVDKTLVEFINAVGFYCVVEYQVTHS